MDIFRIFRIKSKVLSPLNSLPMFLFPAWETGHKFGTFEVDGIYQLLF